MPMDVVACDSEGSLDVKTVLDTAAFMAPLATHLPDMVTYSISLYKNASELIGIATNFFKHNNKAVTVEINNSPGAMPIVNVGNGTVIISDKNILTAAKQIHKGIDTMAEQISKGNADTIDIESFDNEELAITKTLVLNKENKSDFSMPWKVEVTDKFQTFKCGIYKFNKKSGHGNLDLLVKSDKTNFPFEVRNLDHGLFIDALSATYSLITFNSEMKINALGESQIKKIYIHDIENIFGDDPGEVEVDPGPSTDDAGQMGTAS